MLIINQHSHQWKDLSILCRHEQLKLFCGNSSGKPLLSDLRIKSTAQRRRAIYWGITPELESAKFSVAGMKPRPSNIKLFNTRLKSVDIYWRDITSAVLAEVQLHECIELLRQAPNLINVYIIDVFQSPDSLGWKVSLSSYQPIAHLALHQLSFKAYEGGSDIEFFFQAFSFPNLSYLLLNKIYNAGLGPSIISLLNQSSMPLKSLSLYNMYVTVSLQTLLLVLEASPSLVELECKSDI